MPTLTLSFKGMRIQVYPLGPGEVVIGSDPESGIHIDSLAVQPRHASVRLADGVAWLRDLDSPDGTFVNDKKIDAEHELAPGDIIRVGKHNLTYDPSAAAPVEEAEAEAKAPEPEPPPEQPGEGFGEEPDLSIETPAQPKTGWLQILSGQNVGKTIALTRNLTNLGKPGVQMAVIAHRPEGYFLSHLEGKAPPAVDGQPIGDQSWRLEDGNVIQIGNVKMQFYLQ